eukprot:8707044-Heterocapsa_arctica.AAC.1
MHLPRRLSASQRNKAAWADSPPQANPSPWASETQHHDGPIPESRAPLRGLVQLSAYEESFAPAP